MQTVAGWTTYLADLVSIDRRAEEDFRAAQLRMARLLGIPVSTDKENRRAEAIGGGRAACWP